MASHLIMRARSGSVCMCVYVCVNPLFGLVGYKTDLGLQLQRIFSSAMFAAK